MPVPVPVPVPVQVMIESSRMHPVAKLLYLSANLSVTATCFHSGSSAQTAAPTPVAREPIAQPGFFCFAVEPEPGSRTSLCKRTSADCEVSRRGELAAGASAGECVAQGVAFCMSYSGTVEGRPFVHRMCMGDPTGCEALRRQAARDGHGDITACVETR